MQVAGAAQKLCFVHRTETAIGAISLAEVVIPQIRAASGGTAIDAKLL